MEVNLETEISGVPIVVLAKPGTIAWKMKGNINGERYGQYFDANTPLNDVLKSAAASLQEVFGLIGGLT